jgi:hypothetical protein
LKTKQTERGGEKREKRKRRKRGEREESKKLRQHTARAKTDLLFG